MRIKVRALAAVSLLMLVVAIAIRLSVPSPFAPRVRIRWAPDVSAATRTDLERRFALLAGEPHDEATWEYDLADVRPASVRELIAHPAVADTHYLERETATITPDAPAGSVRLVDRRLANWVHSAVFDWFMLLWISSLVVSASWLASPPDARL
jgi:hypothetical protein